MKKTKLEKAKKKLRVIENQNREERVLREAEPLIRDAGAYIEGVMHVLIELRKRGDLESICLICSSLHELAFVAMKGITIAHELTEEELLRQWTQ